MSARRGWPWTVLDLDGVDIDRRAVKRAYAKQLKLIDPQQDPKGFQDLRVAYEQALRMAETKQRGERTASSTSTPSASPTSAPTLQPQMPPVDWVKPAVAVQDRTPDPNALSALSEEGQQLLKARNFDPDTWRSLLNRLVHLDLVQTRQFEIDVLGAFDADLFMDVRQNRAGLPVAWLDLIDDRLGWFSQGLDFQRNYPQHIKLWQLLRDLHRPPLTTKQIETLRKKAELKRDPKVPFYLRWWVLLGGYVGLIIWAA